MVAIVLKNLARGILILAGCIAVSGLLNMVMHRSFWPPEMIDKSLRVGCLFAVLVTLYQARQRYERRHGPRLGR